MAKWDNLNGIIENAIKSNNTQSITGNSLQSVLKSIVNDVGANATFAGIAIASTSPGSYDGPVFYIAASAGTYSGFGSIVVNAGELAVLYNSANGNGWNKSSIGLSSIVDKSITKAKLASDVPIDAMQSKIAQLETAVNTVVGEGATEAIDNFSEILAFLNGIADTTTLEGLLTNLKAEIDGELSNKVDKVSGKGLSTNDYTTAEKNKLAGIAAGANNYTHPSYTARTGVPTANAAPGFGGTFQVSQPVSDAQGHITAVNSRNITIPNSTATASAAGLMAASDKSKLDGIAAGANNYSLPTASGSTLGGVKTGSNITNTSGTISITKDNVTSALGYTPPTQDTNTHYESKTITGASATATANAAATNGNVHLNHIENGSVKSVHNIKGTGATTVTSDANGVITVNSTNTTYGVATTGANGLMSSGDKSKLDGIATGANNYTHPSYTARTGVPTANAAPGFGGTFQVSQPVSDAYGHITAVNARTITIPNSTATASAAGLMAAADKSKLDGIAAGAQVNTITGVKGSAESSYRTGNVNLTPANIGAAASSHIHAAGDITSGTLSIDRIADGSITKEKLADGVLGGSDIFSQINSNGLWLCAGFHSWNGSGYDKTISIDDIPTIGVNVFKMFIFHFNYYNYDTTSVDYKARVKIGSQLYGPFKIIGTAMGAPTTVLIATREANSSTWNFIFNNV